MSTRATLQRGYVLHARSYRETSLLLDCFTLESGRVSMVAKGARSNKNAQRRILQPFTPLLLSYMGRGGSLHTLTAVEEAGQSRRLLGDRLACGLYLNELLVYILGSEEPAEDLFAFYNQSLDGLASDSALSPLLRRFELRLLESIGAAPAWGREADSGNDIEPDVAYGLTSDGPVSAESVGASAALLPGASFLALQAGLPDEEEMPAQCRGILKYFIDIHLAGRKLHSRELLRRPAVKPPTGTP